MINCADYHLPDHHVNIIQLSKVTLMHNTFVYMYLHSYKIHILIDNSKYTNIKRNLHVKYTSLSICCSIV